MQQFAVQRPASQERVATLVVRAWREPDGSVRARIRSTPDAERVAEEVVVTGSIEELSDTLMSWVQGLRSALS